MHTFFSTLALLGLACDGRRLKQANKETKGGPHGKSHASVPNSHHAVSEFNELPNLLSALSPGVAWQVFTSGNHGNLPFQGHYSNHVVVGPSLRSSRQRRSSTGATVSESRRAASTSHFARTHAPQMQTAGSMMQAPFMTCQLSLNVWGEKGSSTPADWSASGSRLFLPVTVTFSNEPFGTAGNPESRLGPREKWHRLIVNGDPTFVSSKGLEHVTVNDGAWRLTPSGHKSGKLLVDFYIDFPNGAVRNDARLPAGRVFFSACAWPEAKLFESRARLEDLLERAAELQWELEEITKAASSKNGSRMERAHVFRAQFAKYDEFRICRKALEYIASGTPSEKETMEVPSCMVHMGKHGDIHIKRRGPARRFFAQEYPPIGTFSFNDPISSAPEVEYETKQLSASTV